MQIKEIKENIKIDLTTYEHQITYLSSLMEGLRLAFYGLLQKNRDIGLSRKDLHGFSSLLECFLENVKEIDSKFYEEVVDKVELNISNQLTKTKNE